MTAQAIVDHMMHNDAFSRWLGVEVLDIGEGHCRLQLQVRAEMTNGFHVSHGGIAYAMADSATAFAANAHGEHAMSIECKMSYLKSIPQGSLLVATATEEHRSKRLGRYRVVLTSNETSVALFYGVVMFLGKPWTTKS